MPEAHQLASPMMRARTSLHADPTSVGGYLDFEKAVYDNVSVRKAA